MDLKLSTHSSTETKSTPTDFKKSTQFYQSFLKRHCRKRIHDFKSTIELEEDSINPCQKGIYEFVKTSISTRPIQQILVHGYGVAGTGKSYISILIRQLFKKNGLRVQVICPTGFLACNFANGLEGVVTAHHFLCLTKYSNILEMCERCSIPNSFVQQNKNLDLLILDEVSMIGALMFYYINLALQIAKGNELPFGGVSIICFYDINQLRPVGGTSLFSMCDKLHADDFNRKGIELFRTFKAFHLKTQQRQSSDVAFQKLLHNVRRRCVDDDDLVLLNSRCIVNLSTEEQAIFETCLKVCQTRLNVLIYNNERLNSMGLPLINLTPQFNPHSHPAFSNFDYPVHIAIGSKVVLTENISTPYRLVNGSKGIVKGVRFGSQNCKLPDVVFVEFSDSLFPVVELNSVPIVAKEEVHYDVRSGKSFSASYFPLSPYYSSTVFKVQGQTLSKICVLLGSTEIWQGSTYTSLSRLRCSNDLVLMDSRVEKNRFNGAKNFLAKEIEESKSLGFYDFIYSPFSLQPNTPCI